jgi:RimJ/RimL family protein N-acetyltransferase
LAEQPPKRTDVPEESPKSILADPRAAVREPPRSREILYASFFDANYAPLFLPWLQTEQELTWLAPGTAPPLTSEKVIAWGKPGDRRFLFWKAGIPAPLGYAELNNMPDRPNQMWIGHFLVDPAYRGRGYGTRFAQALLAMAFSRLSARDVLLVVFPDNASAIRCYHHAGMVPMGHERKLFAATNKEHVFLRMGISATRYHALVAANQLPAEGLPLCRTPLTGV